LKISQRRDGGAVGATVGGEVEEDVAVGAIVLTGDVVTEGNLVKYRKPQRIPTILAQLIQQSVSSYV